MIYGVFKAHGQTVWRDLNTNDREQAKVLLAEAVRKSKLVVLKATHSMTLDGLLELEGGCLTEWQQERQRIVVA